MYTCKLENFEDEVALIFLDELIAAHDLHEGDIVEVELIDGAIHIRLPIKQLKRD